MELDELEAGPARPAAELPPQAVELPLSGLSSGFQVSELGLAIVAQNSTLGDRHPQLRQMRRADRDAA